MERATRDMGALRLNPALYRASTEEDGEPQPRCNTLCDLPDPALAAALAQLPLRDLFAASSTCRRLYEAALPLFAAQLQLIKEQPAGGSRNGSRAAPSQAAAAPAGPVGAGGAAGGGAQERAALRRCRAACGQHLRSACTHCGAIPRGYQAREHPVNPRFRLCRRCTKLEDYRCITQENAESYGLLKTDLRHLPALRESKKVPGKGGGGRWRTYTWYCLQDVEGRAEELFGPGWRDRAEFLSHES